MILHQTGNKFKRLTRLRGVPKMEKLYRDICVRVYGEKHCKAVDKLRKNGVNIKELLIPVIEKKAKAIG